MNQNKVLILTDLERDFYSVLYNLFDKNFTVISRKNYACIAGSLNNSFSLVNDSFKCILLIEQNVIDTEDPHFLNRFEKHIISFEYFLTIEMVKSADEIYKMIQDLVKVHLPEKDKFQISYDINIFNL